LVGRRAVPITSTATAVASIIMEKAENLSHFMSEPPLLLWIGFEPDVANARWHPAWS
jgi:hypothetical protein